MIKTSKTEKVALFVDYADNAKLGAEKEAKLKEYCKDRNYEIVHIYRTEKHNTDTYMILSPIINDFENERIDYSTILTYTIDDILTENDYRKVLSLSAIDDVIKLRLETLKEGVYGEDYLLEYKPSYNIKGRSELIDCNNPYLIKEVEKFISKE